MSITKKSYLSEIPEALKEMVEKITGRLIDVKTSPKEYAEIMCDYYKAIIEAIPVNIYWKNNKDVYLGCNDANAKHSNLKSSEEIIGKTIYDFSDYEEATVLDETDKSIMKSGEAKILEEDHLHLADGSRQVFLTHKIPLKDKNGEVIGLLGASFNITERKKMEEE